MSNGIVDQIMNYLADHQPKRQSLTTGTKTIAAGGTTWFTMAAPANAIGLIGYYIVGTNAGSCNVYAFRIDGGELTLAVRNTASSQASVYVIFSVLCC